MAINQVSERESFSIILRHLIMFFVTEFFFTIASYQLPINDWIYIINSFFWENIIYESNVSIFKNK